MSKHETKKTDKEVNVKNDNFQFKSISVSCSKYMDGEGKKNYRTVFVAQELTSLYVDVEVINRQFLNKKWDAEITSELFVISGDQARSILQKTEKIEVSEELDTFYYPFFFSAQDVNEKHFKPGAYVVMVHINKIGAQSDTIFVMDGDGIPSSYFKLLKVGVDKVCQETEEETKKRPHSYRAIHFGKSEDVRFYLMAENLLKEEWVYEFTVLLSRKNGPLKLKRIVRGNRFVKDDSGKRIFLSAIDFGSGINDFWEKGEYTVQLLAFDHLVMKLYFTIGDKDVPYDYEAELAACSGGHVNQKTMLDKESKDKILDQLYRFVGLRKVKDEITRICEYAEFIRMRHEAGFMDEFPSMHMLFSGNPGTGKRSIAQLIGQLFHSLGVLSHGRIGAIESKDFFGVPIGHEDQIVQQIVEANKGGVLYIDDASGFLHGNPSYERGIVFLKLLIEVVMQDKQDILIILADGAEEMASLTDSIPDLKHYFSRQFHFSDYTPVELMEITHQKLEQKQYRFTPAAEEKFAKMLKRYCSDRGQIFTNGHFIEERLEEASVQMAKRLMSTHKQKFGREDMILIQDEDIVVEKDLEPNHSFEKINSVVKEKQLQQSLIKHLNYVFFVRERQRQGFNDVMPPLNMIFSGNTGTGRLTVAKMLGEIYYGAGILSTPSVVVHNGYNIAIENGSSAEQIAGMLLNSVVGGILYIEDACSIMQSEHGIAVFEALLSSIAPDEYDDVIVILADKPAELEKLTDNNPNLKLYFPYQFNFMDFTPEELVEIAESKLKENNYILHKKSKIALEKLIYEMADIKEKYVGNTMGVDKLVSTIIRNMSERTMKIRQKRVLTRQELTTIMIEDIPVFDKGNPKLTPNFDHKEIDAALKELDRIIGQNKIKKQIRDFVDLARHYAGQGVKLNTKMSLQWCFTGNSGMGKKAIARIIARIYKAMGIIDKDMVFSFKAEKLLGMTEEEALRFLGEILLKSKGGILLFDEDSKKIESIPGFQERVKAILVNQMVEIAGAYMIIFVVPHLMAKEMTDDVEKATDIVNILTFEDYTDEELMSILKKKLEDENMLLSTTARQNMANFISKLNDREERKHSSTRIMRIASELLIRNCLQRISKTDKKSRNKKGLMTVTKSDVVMFNEEFIQNLINERKKIGFAAGS